MNFDSRIFLEIRYTLHCAFAADILQFAHPMQDAMKRLSSIFFHLVFSIHVFPVRYDLSRVP